MGEHRVLRARPLGRHAVLAELASPNDAAALAAHLETDPLSGQCEVVVAARTVLVVGHRTHTAAIRDLLDGMMIPPPPDRTAESVTVDVVYDGVDLDDVARACGMSASAVVDAHIRARWTAAFTGFAPGFAYLVGGGLDVPRRDNPRTAVPPGSVALAGPYSGVYPRTSPGGWQLIGRTGATLWDSDRDPPALIRPGTSVRFHAVREAVAVRLPADVRATVDNGDLRVLRTSPLTLVQDLGRPGYAGMGVPASGAADARSLRLANRVAGNAPGAPALELVDGGLALEALRDVVLAVAGAPVELTVTPPERPLRKPPMAAPFLLRAGDVLELGHPPAGLRTYVAARGGLDVPEVLGSAARDVLSRLGPEPLVAGDELRVLPGRGVVGPPEVQRDFAAAAELRVTVGPRADWIVDALERLCGTVWSASPDSNRVGLRLDGEPLGRARGGELASEPTVRGAVQVPPSGLPLVFLTDHPTTGGYPVVAVLEPEDVDVAAQVRPGDPVRFRLSPG
ncbi:urea amidolyase family protein [Tsukamurella sp. 8F]|uniref:5-oxoprolinase subunit B/C family protein n=1 Tax=unclassified Tsukamurella TaxID=2633480 RepID=UPI0023BA2730|nr:MULTISPECIES: urea amidolyase family protein [unclassified Tsukamurella]MDF0531340.1 urea amidolyase family protein [Tsukamurella sp. 8J]MDF0588546.1 urea amidolyase family protein [Tsukamurella sp. 8F]